MKKSIIIPTLIYLFPLLTSAQFGGVKELVKGAGDIIQTLTLLAAAAALLVFFWGLAKFILAVGGDEEAVKQGRTLMIWGILALFVMTSIWGIVYFIGDEIFPGASYEAPRIPTFPR